MSKHTQGQWKAKQETKHDRAQVWSDKIQVADIYGDCHDEREANSRLIAAAPEMYEALIKVRGMLSGTDESDQIDDVICAALDKTEAA